MEENGKQVKKLREAKLRVVRGRFPVAVPGTYDVVLVSHSLPESLSRYKNFLHKAWEKVNKGGLLLVITFEGAGEELTLLRKELRSGFVDADKEKFRKTVSILQDFAMSAVRIRRVTSTIRTKKSEDLTELLALSIGRGQKESKRYRRTLERIVRLRYKKSAGYSFKTIHLFVSVQKR